MRKKRHAECGTTPSGLAYTSLISQLRQHSYIATVGARSGLKRVLSAHINKPGQLLNKENVLANFIIN